MSYSNLEKEIKDYTDFNKQSLSSLHKLCQFFKTFSQQGIKFAKNSQKALEEFITEFNKENHLLNKSNQECNYTTINITFSYFEKAFQRYMQFLVKNFEEFETKFSNEFSEVINKYENDINDDTDKFNNLLYKYIVRYKNEIKKIICFINLRRNCFGCGTFFI